MTDEDAIRAIEHGTYITSSESDLREMLRACMDIHGSNPVALHRITHAAEIIRQELQSRFLSGERTFLALKEAVAALKANAPSDHDVLLISEGIRVHNVDFIRPHSFLLQGVDDNGHRTGVVTHFSQLKARVVYLPPKGPERVITGFADSRHG